MPFESRPIQPFNSIVFRLGSNHLQSYTLVEVGSYLYYLMFSGLLIIIVLLLLKHTPASEMVTWLWPWSRTSKTYTEVIRLCNVVVLFLYTTNLYAAVALSVIPMSFTGIRTYSFVVKYNLSRLILFVIHALLVSSITVLRCRAHSVAPEIVVRLKNMTVVQGQNVSLGCQFYAVPTPRVTWFKGQLIKLFPNCP